MDILRTKGFSLKKDDYTHLREVLNLLNQLIHHFDQAKTSVLRIKSVKSFLVNFRESADRVDSLHSENKVIRRLQLRTGAAVACAMFAYTPFITSRLCFLLCLLVLKLSVKTGMLRLRKWLDDIVKLHQWRERYRNLRAA